MIESIKNNPSVLNAIRQFESLPSRDRMALKILSLVVLILILYFSMWVPAKAFMDQNKSDLEFNKQLLALVVDNKTTLSSMNRSGASSSAKILDSQQLVSSVTNLAKQNKIALKRFEPSGENKLKVWVDDAPFDKMIKWLDRMKKSLGVTVEQITIEKDDSPGLVSARMTLSS